MAFLSLDHLVEFYFMFLDPDAFMSLLDSPPLQRLQHDLLATFAMSFINFILCPSPVKAIFWPEARAHAVPSHWLSLSLITDTKKLSDNGPRQQLYNLSFLPKSQKVQLRKQNKKTGIEANKTDLRLLYVS